MKKLPELLCHQIEKVISLVQLAPLKEACADLSARYQQSKFIETDLHRFAYIAARLPATYGVLCSVFEKIQPYLNESPSFLDVGAGVGSSLWAAHEYIPHLSEVTLLEKDMKLIELGSQLSKSQPSNLVINHINQDIFHYDSFNQHDISLASYVLNELSAPAQLRLIERLYKSINNLLILIEPGTPNGFKNIIAARSHLIKLGANILAPCPHNYSCPLDPLYKSKHDWCHFTVRIHRERFHQIIKEGSLPYEDEKYCYLVASPIYKRKSSSSRIIKNPIKKGGHVILDLCQPNGKEQRHIVSKKTKQIYSKAKSVSWGDTWEGPALIDEINEES